MKLVVGKSGAEDSNPKSEFRKAERLANDALAKFSSLMRDKLDDTALLRKEIRKLGGNMRTTQVVVTLDGFLDDKREIIRIEAAETLGNIGDVIDVRRLENRLNVEESEFVRYYLREAIEKAKVRKPVVYPSN